MLRADIERICRPLKALCRARAVGAVSAVILIAISARGDMAQLGARLRQRGPAGLAASAWPKACGNARNSGEGHGRGAAGHVRWVFTTGGAIQSSPSIGSDGTVYVGATDNKVYAIDGRTGQERWKRATEGYIRSTPAIGADGVIYFGSEDGSFNALDAQSGDLLWTYRPYPAAAPIMRASGADAATIAPRRAGPAVDTSPTIGANGTVYVEYVGVNAGMTALDARTGRVKWRRQDGGCGWGCPAIMADGSLVESFDGGLRWLGAATGRVLAVIQLRSADPKVRDIGGNSSIPVVGPDGAVYFGRMDAHGNGQFFAVDSGTWRIKWQRACAQVYAPPAVARDGTVYVGQGHLTDPKQSMVYALDGATGREKWARRVGPGFFTSPAIAADGSVYIGCSDGYVYALSGDTGALKWRVRVGSVLTGGPAIGADGTVFVGADNHNLYAID